jgi:hypothetical protein
MKLTQKSIAIMKLTPFNLASIVLVSAGLLMSSMATADTPAATEAATSTITTAATPATASATPDAAFQASKAEYIAIAEERVQIVQKYLACLQAITDQAGIKACREAAKKDGDVLDAKMKAQQDLNKQTKHAKKNTN